MFAYVFVHVDFNLVDFCVAVPISACMHALGLQCVCIYALARACVYMCLGVLICTA